MCGIAGFVSSRRQVPGAREIVERMSGAIAHRGPDECGSYFDDFASLGHRRLSIIDLRSGQQPMSSEEGRYWIVYNGEIFNHDAIRPELERAGHVYHSHCDTETILHAYEEFGPACVERFRGMFSFAIWDQAAKTLFCARDRLGIKPFYYFWNGETIVFASEIKALLEHPAITAEFDEAVLPEYLAFGYLSGERTMFRGIKKLMPGHVMTLNLLAPGCAPRITAYWDVPVPPEQETRPEADWIAETRSRFEEVVRMRLMSDVPLGMFLSGGVDSSAIAAMIRRLTGGPLKTFAVGYAEAEYSELAYARQVAQTIGTEHHEVVLGMEDFFAALPGLIWHEDEPIAFPSSVSLYFVARLAAEQVKVVLTGEGSDELFGGYSRYRWYMLNQRAASVYGVAPAFLRSWVRQLCLTTPLLRADLRRKLAHTFIGRENTVESLYLDNFYSAFSLEEQNDLLQSSAEAVYGTYHRYWNAQSAATPLQRMLYADQKTYLVELLMKQDQMSMAASIESRVPFLDHTFVEFAMRIPDALKVHGSTQKYIFKKAVEDLLPADITYRKKMGFPTPLRAWLRSPEAEAMLSSLTDRKGFLARHLDMAQVQALIDRHRAGAEDATDRLWRLLNLQLWAGIFLAGNRAGKPQSQPLSQVASSRL